MVKKLKVLIVLFNLFMIINVATACTIFCGKHAGGNSYIHHQKYLNGITIDDITSWAIQSKIYDTQFIGIYPNKLMSKKQLNWAVKASILLIKAKCSLRVVLINQKLIPSQFIKHVFNLYEAMKYIEIKDLKLNVAIFKYHLDGPEKLSSKSDTSDQLFTYKKEEGSALDCSWML